MVGYQKLVLFITVIICTAAIFAFFKYALLGKAMLAAADNREGAIAVGVDQSRMILIAVLVSGGDRRAGRRFDGVYHSGASEFR